MACRGSAVRVRLAPLGFQGFEDYNLIQLVQNLVQNKVRYFYGMLTVAWHAGALPAELWPQISKR